MVDFYGFHVGAYGGPRVSLPIDKRDFCWKPKPPLDMAAGGRMTPALFTSLGATCQPGCVVGSGYT